MLQHDGRLRAQEEPTQRGRTPERAGLSRGQFLRLGDATAAGAVPAGASGLLHVTPAAAATGNPLVIGTSNCPTNTSDTTTLTLPYTGPVGDMAPCLLRVSNEPNTPIVLPEGYIAVAGLTSGAPWNFSGPSGTSELSAGKAGQAPA